MTPNVELGKLRQGNADERTRLDEELLARTPACHPVADAKLDVAPQQLPAQLRGEIGLQSRRTDLAAGHLVQMTNGDLRIGRLFGQALARGR